jgi:hypothetical protein
MRQLLNDRLRRTKAIGTLSDGFNSGSARICYLHVGTHKTGTTSIQRRLTADESAHLAAGLHVPRASRTDPLAGHHNLAWELNDDPRFDPAHGTLADVLDEIADVRAERACLSSEDFEYLAGRPQRLARLTDGLRTIGYAPVVVVYLRPQADYAESLYAELVKFGLTLGFDAFLDRIVGAGSFWFDERWCYTFDYERLLDGFAQVVGPQRVVARRYDGGSIDVVADFLTVVGAHVPALRVPGRDTRLNRGLSFEQVVAHIARNARAVSPSAPARNRLVGGRFDPIDFSAALRIMRRFNAGNCAVHRRYGPRVPCVGGRDLLYDCWSALGADPAGRYRRRVLAAWNLALLPPPRRASLAKRLRDRVAGSPLLAAARLDTVIAVTATVVALASFVFGQQIASTTLVEFAMLSVVRAVAAATTAVRSTVEAIGIIADDRYLNAVGNRMRSLAYAAIGCYALANAVLDIGWARHDPDWISFPGEIAVALAALILTGVGNAKRRLSAGWSRRLTDAAFGSERGYAACTYAAALVEGVHAVQPVWWLDTIVDVVVALFALVAVARSVRQT